MNHALLKSVIYDQHEFIRDFQIVPRNYEFEENGNYVLVGLRRAGKSTLLYKIVLDLVASGVDWEGWKARQASADDQLREAVMMMPFLLINSGSSPEK